MSAGGQYASFDHRSSLSGCPNLLQVLRTTAAVKIIAPKVFNKGVERGICVQYLSGH